MSDIQTKENGMIHEDVFRSKQIGTAAIELGFMTHEQVNHVLSKQLITQQRFGQLCLEEGFLNEEQMAQLIASQYFYEYVDLRGLEDVSASLAERHELVHQIVVSHGPKRLSAAGLGYEDCHDWGRENGQKR